MRRILVDVEGRWVDVMIDPPDPDDQILVLDWDAMEEMPELALPTAKDAVAWLAQLADEENPDKDLRLRLEFALDRISDRGYLRQMTRIPGPWGWWALTTDQEELQGQDDLTDPKTLEATLLLLPVTITQLAWCGRGGSGHLFTWPGRPGEILGLVVGRYGRITWYGSGWPWEQVVTRAVSQTRRRT